MQRLRWDCARCGQEIGDGEGSLAVDRAAAVEIARSWLAPAEQDVPVFAQLADLDAITPARWQARHAACDPLPGPRAFAVDVARVRTAGALLRLVAHVLDKQWHTGTDLAALLREVAEQLADAAGETA